MKGQDLFRKLIVRAPLDLVATIYERGRQRDEVDADRPSWPEIIRAAQDLGIFSEEEGLAFLQVIADRPENAVGDER